MKLIAAHNRDKVFFYDHCSVPQEPLDSIQQGVFDAGLNEMRHIFMEGKVVALATNDDYYDRAWCLMEVFAHLLSPRERSMAVVSLNSAAFVAHLLTIIEGAKYTEGNEISPSGWKSRTMPRVDAGLTSMPGDKQRVMAIMQGFILSGASRVEASAKATVEFCSPRGTALIVAN